VHLGLIATNLMLVVRQSMLPRIPSQKEIATEMPNCPLIAEATGVRRPVRE
jgi:hypothetical protein